MAKKAAKKAAKKSAKKIAKKAAKKVVKKAVKKAAKAPAKPMKKAKKAGRRTVLRSSKGKKLYAVRDGEGKFKDIQSYQRAHSMDIKRNDADDPDEHPEAGAPAADPAGN